MRTKVQLMTIVVLSSLCFLAAPARAERFVDNHDGTITDTSTNLVWQEVAQCRIGSWTDAIAYCQKLKLGGLRNWRVPRIDELVTIVDHHRRRPAMDQVFNSSHQARPRLQPFWSRTVDVSDQNAAWGIDFMEIGGVESFLKQTSPYPCVRCVHGGPFWTLDPATHLEAHTDNTVRDTLTELIWQKADDGIQRPAGEIKTYCRDLEIDGFDDWRRPTVDELLSIVDYTTHDPAISSELFQAQPDSYWTRSDLRVAADDSRKWLVDFSSGVTKSTTGSDDMLRYTRCVRAGNVPPGTVTVSMRGTGAGQVVSSPPGIQCGDACTHSFVPGEQVTLTATPHEGSDFKGWILPAECTYTLTCTVTADEESIVAAAQFEPVSVVSIRAVSSVVREQRSRGGRFEVSREATGYPLEHDCRVYYKISGTAVDGKDYKTLSGSVLIPRRMYSSIIKVIPISDKLDEGNETVILTIEPREYYQIGKPSNAKMVIRDDD